MRECENKDCKNDATIECPECDSDICEDCYIEEDGECPICGYEIEEEVNKHGGKS